MSALVSFGGLCMCAGTTWSRFHALMYAATRMVFAATAGHVGAEVAHRLARKMRTLSQKFTRHELPPRDEGARDLRFLPPFIAVAPEHLTAAAERVLDGKYSFFDLADCELGDPPQWNRDPLTQRGTGARRASAIDYRDEREVGNIKYLWEPNRHLHLPLLAQAHAATGERATRLPSSRRSTRGLKQCPEGWGPELGGVRWSSASD